MTSKRLVQSLFALILTLALSSCASPGDDKTSEPKGRSVGSSDSKAAQTRLDEAKEQLLSGDDKKGYWLLRSLNYFALPKNQQEQCDILWKRWKRVKTADFSKKYENSTWEKLRTYRDVNLVVLDIDNKKLVKAQLELRLRNYQTSQSLFTNLLKSKTLTPAEKKFSKACVALLKSAVEESQAAPKTLPSAEQTQSQALKKD